MKCASCMCCAAAMEENVFFIGDSMHATFCAYDLVKWDVLGMVRRFAPSVVMDGDGCVSGQK